MFIINCLNLSFTKYFQYFLFASASMLTKGTPLTIRSLTREFNPSRVQPPFRNAIRSALSFALEIPAKAMAFPGAKPAGDASHLSKLASDHFRVALDERAEE